MSDRPLVRGPRKARDPLGTTDQISDRCTAHSKRTGKLCGRSAIPGGRVCRYHGGLAPQVQKKAEDRLLMLQDAAVSRLAELMLQNKFPSTAYQAVRDILDRTMGKPSESVAVEHSGKLEIEWLK